MQTGALPETLVLFLLLMIPGYLMEKFGRLPERTLPGIANVMMDVAMPALVLVKLLQTDLAGLEPAAVVCCALLPIGVGLTLLCLSGLVFRGRDAARLPAARFCAAFPNCGFWSIPLAAALYPEQPAVAVYVSLFNVCNSCLLLTAGVFVLSADRRDISTKRIVTSPVLLAMVLGMILSVSGASVPRLERAAELLSQLATPLSMLVLGAETARLKLGAVVQNKDLYLTCLLKLVLSPLLAMGVLLVLNRWLQVPISDTLAAAMFLATAVSTALSAPAMSAKYELDAAYAAELTIGTTLLCVVTMPLLHGLVALF